LVRIEMR